MCVHRAEVRCHRHRAVLALYLFAQGVGVDRRTLAHRVLPSPTATGNQARPPIYLLTVTRRKVAGIEVLPALVLVFLLSNSVASSFLRSPARPFFSAASKAFDDLRSPTGGTNHWFAAYDIRQFVDPDQFSAEVRGVRERVQHNPPRRGFDRVYAPGDLENDNARNYQRDGVPLEQFTLDELAWVAEHTGVPLPFPTTR